MKVRHEARLRCDDVEQIGIRLDAVDGGQAQPFEIGQGFQQALDEAAEAQVAALVRGDVDAGEDDVARALIHSLANCGENGFGRDRAGLAPAERNDAERAAMVAAVLNLDEAPGVVVRRGEPTRAVPRRRISTMFRNSSCGRWERAG